MHRDRVNRGVVWSAKGAESTGGQDLDADSVGTYERDPVVPQPRRRVVGLRQPDEAPGFTNAVAAGFIEFLEVHLTPRFAGEGYPSANIDRRR